MLWAQTQGSKVSKSLFSTILYQFSKLKTAIRCVRLRWKSRMGSRNDVNKCMSFTFGGFMENFVPVKSAKCQNRVKLLIRKYIILQQVDSNN